MRHVGLVTYRGLLELSRDDQLVLSPLAERGVRATAVAWDDTTVTWGDCDALVVRSTWNYHTRPDAFRAWIDRVESVGVPLWNPPPILRWNSDKTYLRDLAGRGVDVVTTRWVEAASGTTLREVAALGGWHDAVIKPAVSASAHETWRVSLTRISEADESRFRRMLGTGAVMVQPFIPELAREGEWSLVFLGGEYSHAVLKRPRAGDFRVQAEHGGTAEPRRPPRHVRDAATAILSRVDAPLLYARVDGVEIDGRFVLVELEVLEPSLFLSADAGAPARFAAAIASRLGRRA